jgi:histidinol-phosphate aminotransferase
MLPHMLDALPYAAVDPPSVLAARAGIPEGDIAKLDANENPYGPSPKVAQALASYQGYHIYPDPQQRRVREALADYAGSTPDHIVAGVGSDELIDLLLRLFVTQGDSVIDCVPTFGMYASFVSVVGGELVSVPRTKVFDIDIDGIRKAAKKGAKMVFLASPNNPTGNLVDEASVRQLLGLDMVVVVDEAYYEFAGSTVASLVLQYPNLVVLRTFSKWAGLAGIRLGYGIMDPAVAERLMVAKPPYNLSVAAEVALLASLEDRALLLSRVQSIVAERDNLFAQLLKIPGLVPLPSSTNFILCHLTEWQGYSIYHELSRRGIFVRYYNTPVLQDYIRVSVGLPAQNKALVGALQTILA